MKIIETRFDKDVLMIKILIHHSVECDSEITLFVDECSNINKISSDNPEDHDYVFTQENSAINFILLEHINDLYTYAIYIELEIIENLDKHLKYLTLFVHDDNAEFVYYNREAVYKALINKLRCVCSTCLDDHMMLKTMMVTFKQQLLEQSIYTEHYIDSVNHYLDLCRMLDMHVIKYNNFRIPHENDFVHCNKCINGICKLN